MRQRLLPTLVALGCGFLALCWGLVSLQRIFLQEREDAFAQVRSRRAALEQYATESLHRTLQQRMEASLPALHTAMGDVLAPAEGFYLRFRGHQFLPRPSLPAPGTRAPARHHLESLLRLVDEPSPKGTWRERLLRLRAAESALVTGAGARADALIEEVLRYHVEHPLPAAEALPFSLLVVERLRRGANTRPLVRALVREGLPEELGGWARGAGLQRDLLRERSHLTRQDFDFLHARILRVSAALGEPTEDFLAREREAGAGLLVMPEAFEEPTLIGQHWYVEPRGEELVRGMAVELEPLLESLTRAMHEQGLFDAAGRVRLRSKGAVQPLSELRLEVAMPQWAAAEADIQQRYGLKTLLVTVCGALAATLVVLAGVAQERKYRFVELKSDFVATVSHELRTPLASLRLLAETLERKLAEAPELRGHASRLIHVTDGLHFLVENLLSFNRIDKGRWTPRPERVRLEELVDTLRADLEDVTAVPVQLDSDVQEVELWADPSLLRLLLANLGRNACVYNRRSPVRLSLTAHMAPGRGCTVLVSDNGVGLPESEWENVFGDFYRLSPPGDGVNGSGLGLALCRRIMRLHHGHIHIAASSPEGTTFALTFPEP